MASSLLKISTENKKNPRTRCNRSLSLAHDYLFFLIQIRAIWLRQLIKFLTDIDYQSIISFSKMSLPRIITKHFINGQFVKGVSGKTFDVINPSDESVMAKVEKGCSQDVDAAVKHAREAF